MSDATAGRCWSTASRCRSPRSRPRSAATAPRRASARRAWRSPPPSSSSVRPSGWREAAEALTQLTDVGDPRDPDLVRRQAPRRSSACREHAVALEGLTPHYLNNAVAALRLSSLPDARLVARRPARAARRACRRSPIASCSTPRSARRSGRASSALAERAAIERSALDAADALARADGALLRHPGGAGRGPGFQPPPHRRVGSSMPRASSRPGSCRASSGRPRHARACTRSRGQRRSSASSSATASRSSTLRTASSSTCVETPRGCTGTPATASRIVSLGDQGLCRAHWRGAAHPVARSRVRARRGRSRRDSHERIAVRHHRPRAPWGATLRSTSSRAGIASRSGTSNPSGSTDFLDEHPGAEVRRARRPSRSSRRRSSGRAGS